MSTISHDASAVVMAATGDELAVELAVDGDELAVRYGARAALHGAAAGAGYVAGSLIATYQ